MRSDTGKVRGEGGLDITRDPDTGEVSSESRGTGMEVFLNSRVLEPDLYFRKMDQSTERLVDLCEVRTEFVRPHRGQLCDNAAGCQ